MKSRTVKPIVLGFILLLGIVLFGSMLSVSSDSSDREHTIEINSPPSVLYSTYEGMNKRSDLIVSGTIVNIQNPKWSTEDEKQPEGVVVEEVMKEGKKYVYYSFDLKEGETIYTDIIFSVEKCYKGEVKSQEITIRSFGGTINGLKMNDAETLNPENFKEGDKLLLYLIEDNGTTGHIGPEHYVFLAPLGKLTYKHESLIDIEGKKVNIDEILKK
ncbi:hypothetical protein [Methanolapillus ohkumae]|uniref:Uncharacterized protein n=1 Tax=Methanolapillus ohkumae TaxID=3028298 RepID=A0AA96ZV86_9EURY|nr:hypothetical protein MsAm2_02110 [Methanosarcinaceae archaeon Am2]